MDTVLYMFYMLYRHEMRALCFIYVFIFVLVKTKYRFEL